MNVSANYEIVRVTNGAVVLRDVGPHDRYLTITNAAERVCNEIYETHDTGIGGKRLFYYDSEGELAEILTDWQGRFSGFKHARESDVPE